MSTDPNKKVLNEEDVKEAVLGRDLAKLESADYVDKVIEALYDGPFEFYKILKIAEILAQSTSDDAEKEDMLKRIRLIVLEALNTAKIKLQERRKKIKEELNKKYEVLLKEPNYLEKIRHEVGKDMSLTTDQVEEKSLTAIWKRVYSIDPESFALENSLKKLLNRIDEVPDDLLALMDEEKNRRRKEKEDKERARKEAEKKAADDAAKAEESRKKKEEDEAVEKQKAEGERKKKLEEDEMAREKLKKGLDLVVVDVEDKIDRIAERVGTAKLHKQMAGMGPKGWKDFLIFPIAFYKGTKKWIYRNAMEAIRQRYVDEARWRIRNDGNFRAELMENPGEVKLVKSKEHGKVPEAGATYDLNPELDAIAERIGISFTAEEGQTYANESEKLMEMEEEYVEVDEKLREIVDEWVKAKSQDDTNDEKRDNKFRDRINRELIPLIGEQIGTTNTLRVFVDQQSKEHPGLEKMGLLDQLKRHQDGLTRLGTDELRIKLKLGKATNVDTRTKVRTTGKWDRFTRWVVEGTQKNKFLNKFVSPVTVSIGMNLLAQAAGSTVVRAGALTAAGLLLAPNLATAGAIIGAGCLVGGAYAMLRKNKEMLWLKAEKETRSELTPDTSSGAEGGIEKEMEEKGAVYEKISALGMAEIIERTKKPDELLKALAEAIARNELSAIGLPDSKDENKVVGLLSYNEQTIEQERLQLLHAIATGRESLKKMYKDQNLGDHEEALKEEIRVQRAILIEDLKLSDKSFNKIKRWEVLKDGAVGAAIGAVVGGSGLLASHLIGFHETVDITGGSLDSAQFDAALSSRGLNAGQIADIHTHINDPGYIKSHYGIEVHHEVFKDVEKLYEPFAGGARMTKEELLTKLAAEKPGLDPKKVFDLSGHIDAKYMKNFGIDIDELPVSSDKSVSFVGRILKAHKVVSESFSAAGGKPNYLAIGMFPGAPMKHLEYKKTDAAQPAVVVLPPAGSGPGSTPPPDPNAAPAVTRTPVSMPAEIPKYGIDYIDNLEDNPESAIKLLEDTINELKKSLTKLAQARATAKYNDAMITGLEEFCNNCMKKLQQNVNEINDLTGRNVFTTKKENLDKLRADLTAANAETLRKEIEDMNEEIFYVQNGMIDTHNFFITNKRKLEELHDLFEDLDRPAPASSPAPVQGQTNQPAPQTQGVPDLIPPASADSIPDLIPTPTADQIPDLEPASVPTAAPQPAPAPAEPTTPADTTAPAEKIPSKFEQNTSLDTLAEHPEEVIENLKRNASRFSEKMKEVENLRKTGTHNTEDIDNAIAYYRTLRNRFQKIADDIKGDIESRFFDQRKENLDLLANNPTEEDKKYALAVLGNIEDSLIIINNEIQKLFEDATGAEPQIREVTPGAIPVTPIIPTETIPVMAEQTLTPRLKSRFFDAYEVPDLEIVDAEISSFESIIANYDQLKADLSGYIKECAEKENDLKNILKNETDPDQQNQLDEILTLVVRLSRGAKLLLIDLDNFKNDQKIASEARLPGLVEQFNEAIHGLQKLNLPQSSLEYVDYAQSRWVEEMERLKPTDMSDPDYAQRLDACNQEIEKRKSLFKELRKEVETMTQWVENDWFDPTDPNAFAKMDHFINRLVDSDRYFALRKIKPLLQALTPKTNVQESVNATEPESAEKFRNIRSRFLNEGEHRNWEKLTADEQEQVRELTESIAQDASLFYMQATKPHAVEHERIGLYEHHPFLVKGDAQQLNNIDQELSKKLSHEIKVALNDSEMSDLNKVQILDHPNDATKVVIRFLLKNPEMSSFNDNRVTHNNYVLVVSKSNPIVNLLRSKQNARTITFALRYAAVALNKNAIVFADVPLEGREKFGSTRAGMGIIDVPNRRVVMYSTHTSGEITTANDKTCTTDAELLDLAKTYDFTGGDHEWRGIKMSVGVEPDKKIFDGYRQRLEEMGLKADLDESQFTKQPVAKIEQIDEREISSNADNVLNYCRYPLSEENRKAVADYLRSKPDSKTTLTNRYQVLMQVISNAEHQDMVLYLSRSPRQKQNDALLKEGETNTIKRIVSNSSVSQLDESEKPEIERIFYNAREFVARGPFKVASYADLSPEQSGAVIEAIRTYLKLKK